MTETKLGDISDAAIDAALAAIDADTASFIAGQERDSIVRRMWLEGARGQDIRQAIDCDVRGGIIGHRVKALDLPVRDHKLQPLTHANAGPVHPLHGDAADDEE